MFLYVVNWDEKLGSRVAKGTPLVILNDGWPPFALWRHFAERGVGFLLRGRDRVDS